MSTGLSGADINSYLAVTGWVRQPQEWRGAAVWLREGDHEIFVPGTDDLADGPRRVREILALLARLEGRSREEIASDIGAPMADVQWYRSPIFPADGRLGLGDAAVAFESAQAALTAAARAVLAPGRPVFAGAPPREVRELLARVRVGPIVPSTDVLTIRVPLERDEADGIPLARRTLILLQRAMVLLRDAVSQVHETRDMDVFDGIVRDGVSADLCAALARMAGSDPEGRMEAGFRWARAAPSEVPVRTVVFEPGTKAVLSRAAHRFHRLHSENASVTGRIVMLGDDGDRDRFRVQIRGEPAAGEDQARRLIWVRLPGEAAYDMAVAAHRSGTLVRAEGTLHNVNGRRELVATGFGPLPADRSEETT
ncbi:hypothetical protein [Spongiactinospora sp. 9N601]|uniref:hypothetical protein n=1 Tax=Spongiactinospora sp. 9N601 TaxID=3375149 RepID=UPI003790A537